MNLFAILVLDKNQDLVDYDNLECGTIYYSDRCFPGWTYLRWIHVYYYIKAKL